MLLARNGVNRVDDVPVMDSLAAWSRWRSRWWTCGAARLGAQPARLFSIDAAARASRGTAGI